MRCCGQTRSQSVLEHGFSVKNYLFDLLNHLEKDTPLRYEWRIPDWVLEHREYILKALPEPCVLKLYTVMHDCGKPVCVEFDEMGNRHFPDHAEVSYRTFTQFYDCPQAADLIRHDMDIHLLKADGVDTFVQNPNAIALLITGLAELHSNANMFGGIESTSFKIKWKNIDKRGRQILKTLTNTK